MGIPSWMGFCRPQLVVVSGLFDGNPSMDGIFLGHNLLLSQAFSVGIPRWMGFRLSGSLSHELFSFFTMEFRLSGSLSHELFSFFTMEFRLSGSLSHELFSFFTMEFSRHKIRNMQFGGRLFSYIYRKEYLHGIRLVKNLAS
jgi:hypothetical protein